MAETTKPAPAFSRDELQRMADELTMGDVWRSQKEAPDNRAEVGMRAFWHSAGRLEMIAKDVDFESFIDRVKSDDFRAVNAPAATDVGKADSEPRRE
jgi:hypothetical protein